MDLEYRDVIVGSAPPPPGVTPNFVNPEYRSGGIVPISAVFTILSTVFLVLRLYTKIGIVHLFGLEDGMYGTRCFVGFIADLPKWRLSWLGYASSRLATMAQLRRSRKG